MLGWNEKIKKQLKYCGNNVCIGHQVLFVRPERVFIEDNVRIDPFTLVTCNELFIGSNVQICSHVILGGSQKIKLMDWSWVGYHSRLFTASEDYSGEWGPVNNFWNKDNKLYEGDIVFNEFAGIASNVTVMPGVNLPEGTAIGAESFVYDNYYKQDSLKCKIEPYTVYVGRPLRFLKKRNKENINAYRDKRVFR